MTRQEKKELLDNMQHELEKYNTAVGNFNAISGINIYETTVGNELAIPINLTLHNAAKAIGCSVEGIEWLYYEDRFGRDFGGNITNENAIDDFLDSVD